MDGFNKRLTVLQFKILNRYDDIEKKITICEDEIGKTIARVGNLELFEDQQERFAVFKRILQQTA